MQCFSVLLCCLSLNHFSAMQEVEFNLLLLQALRSFMVHLDVELKYHPNIIGKKGVTINKIRDDHDVKIQLPEKDSNDSEIIITGGCGHFGRGRVCVDMDVYFGYLVPW